MIKLCLAGVVLCFSFIQIRASEVLVFYALDSDLQQLKGGTTTTPISIAGTIGQKFTISGHKVVAAKMGVGSIETAITTTSMLSRFPADIAISIGPAGALSDDLAIGDVVVVEEVVGYQRGSWKESVWALSKEATVYPSADIAEQWLGSNFKRTKVASGEAFIAGEQARKTIQSETQCQIVDMNSYGFALACQKAGVPYLILRVVSDKADSDASDSFRKFVADYDGSMGGMLRKLIAERPVSKENPSAYQNIQKILDE